MMRRTDSPLAELIELQKRAMQLFEQARAERERLAAQPRLAPPMDVAVSDDEYRVQLDLPGVAAEDVRVLVDQGTLVIRADKQRSEGLGRSLRQERSYGPVLRTLHLPRDADPEKASATLADGVLTVRVARRPRGGKVEIPVVEEEMKEQGAQAEGSGEGQDQ